MKICLKCNRGLLDRDMICDKCGCTDIMDKKEYTNLYNTFQNASEKKRQELRKAPEYQLICKYKFIVDKNNTIEKRKVQSAKDKEKFKQEQNQYYQSLQQKSYQKQVSKTKDEQKFVPKCPTCHSTNLSKITTAHKAGKIALFGIFGMGDNGKTWKCNNCGSKF